MVASAFSFSLMSLCVKQLGGRIPVAEVVFIRALISLVLSWWVIQRQGVNPWGNRRPMLIWRGVVGTLALFCFYGAISQLPLAAATVLQYLYPTFTAALAWGALGERAGKRILLAMALGWLGVLLVAQPDWLAQLTGDSAMDPLPALAVAIGITGALLTALAYVTVRHLATDEHRSVIIFYFPLMSVPMRCHLYWPIRCGPTQSNGPGCSGLASSPSWAKSFSPKGWHRCQRHGQPPLTMCRWYSLPCGDCSFWERASTS